MYQCYSYVNDKPIVNLFTKYSDSGELVEYLVDSGADQTILSKISASLLGIDYECLESKPIETEAINGSSLFVKESKVFIEIGGVDFRIPVWIADRHIMTVLGRRGVFDRFDLIFQERKNPKRLVFSREMILA